MKSKSKLVQNTPSAFDGWALERAAVLDTNGSRGLVADLSLAPIIKRQAAFAVMAVVPLDAPEAFLHAIGQPEARVGDVIRTRYAREILFAAFGRLVPGYLRVLTRVGPKPLSDPSLYRRLFDIYADPAQSRTATALRYCGPIDAERIRIADALDPILVRPEIVKHLRSVRHAREANAVFRAVLKVCSGIPADVLATAMAQSLPKGGLSQFAERCMRRADRFPEPPLRSSPEIVPLTSAREMADLGQAMRNCLATKVPHAALGLAAYYRTEVHHGAGVIPVVAELRPLSTGGWLLEDLHSSRRITPEVRALLVRKLVNLGAVVGANPRLHPTLQRLVRPLGLYDIGEFQFLNSADEDDDGSEITNLDAAVAEVEREFELLGA
jgi:hypothetical protein